MIFKRPLVIAAASALLSSACFAQGENGTSGDVDLLNYALTLEHLEYAFYRDGLALLDASNWTDHSLVQRLTDIRDHEKTHVDALTNAITGLGATPVSECKYDFGYNDSASFLKIARVLENVGVAAYDGAGYGVQNKALLTAAATIATVEARHAAYLNIVNNLNPFPSPFDSALDPSSVVGLASVFIVNCSGDGLAFQPRPQIDATPLWVRHGANVNITSKALGSNSSSPLYCVFLRGSHLG